MNILKKIWDEINRLREIRIISYECPDEEDNRLFQEFKNRQIEIRKNNYKKIMAKLINYCRDIELSNTGLLLPDHMLIEKAHALFCNAKKDGWLDSLNNIKDGADV